MSIVTLPVHHREESGVWLPSHLSSECHAAGCSSSHHFMDEEPITQKPSDPQKAVQAGRAEADPDVGLLTMASFPPLAQESTIGQWPQPG